MVGNEDSLARRVERILWGKIAWPILDLILIRTPFLWAKVYRLWHCASNRSGPQGVVSADFGTIWVYGRRMNKMGKRWPWSLYVTEGALTGWKLGTPLPWTRLPIQEVRRGRQNAKFDRSFTGCPFLYLVDHFECPSYVFILFYVEIFF